MNVVAVLALLSTHAFAQCGVERWPVKTGTDPDSGLVNLNSATPATIGSLAALSTPSNLPQNNRVQPAETTVFVVQATLTAYKLEADSDYHVVLSDSAGKTMIGEIPSPNCVGSTSPFAAATASARSQFNARLTATTSFKTASIPVQVKGVGFFDFLHGQTGVAPNGIELHPVLDIIFDFSSPPASVVSLSPSTSVGANQVYTVVVSDTSGFQDLGIINVLVNTGLDGVRACYLAYSVPNSVLYLVSDNGSSLSTGLALNGSGSIANSQCSVSSAGSSAVGSGNGFTLTLNMSFTPAFAGNKVMYVAARTIADSTSGWNLLGVRDIPGTPLTFPRSVSVTPSSGNSNNSVITFAYQDATSANNLQTSWVLMNTGIDARSACYVAYYRPGNLIFLYPDNGDGTQATSMTLTGTNSLSNSQCTVSSQGSSVAVNGNQLDVNLNITFKPAFGGPKAIWTATSTLSGQTSNWQALAVRQIPIQ